MANGSKPTSSPHAGVSKGLSYTDYFGLREAPFSIAPDPEFLYMSHQHQEALAHLLYGSQGDGGFVLLTGEVGTGKTTVCRCFLEQLPDNYDVAFVVNPKLTAEELLATICEELCVLPFSKRKRSCKELIDIINAQLLESHARGRNTILIIDEAQQLNRDVLEQMRLLTNLETNKRKLLQIIMVGQPELRDVLERPEMRQLAQRITARYHLGPLIREEVGYYVRHRLAIAGCEHELFPDSTLRLLYRLTEGVPRLINVICDRALLGAYVEGKRSVDRKILQKAAREVFGRSGSMYDRWKNRNAWLLGAAASLVIIMILAAGSYIDFRALTSGRHVAKTDVPVADESAAIPKAAGKNGSPSKSETNKTVVGEGAVVSSQTHGLEWPLNEPIERSETAAFQALFLQWDIPFQEKNEVEPCRQAELNGLRCLSGTAKLADLIRLDRPAVLSLYNDKKERYYVTLVSLQGDRVTCMVGGRVRLALVAELKRRWTGEYRLLWRPPPGYERELRLGDDGSVVRWLALRLAILHYWPWRNLDRTVYYDESLRTAVQKFQTANELTPDGIAGPHTLMRINTQSGIKVPRLVSAKDDQHVVHSGSAEKSR